MSAILEQAKPPVVAINVALCKGRHPIKTNEGIEVTESIFGDIPSEHINDFAWLKEQCVEWFKGVDTADTNELNVYVTGLTQALTTFMSVFVETRLFYHSVNFWHFDRDTAEYVCNPLFDNLVLELAGIDIEEEEE